MKAKKIYLPIIILALALTPVLAVKATSSFTLENVRAELARLLEQVNILQAQFNNSANAIQNQNIPANFCYNFKKNLGIGDRGNDVSYLNQILNKEGFQAPTGNAYTEQTASAVTGLQQKYSDKILAPLGLRYGTGYFGQATRKLINANYPCSNGNGTEKNRADITIKVTEIRYCITVPCDAPIIHNATVGVYALNGAFVGSQRTSNGYAAFKKLPYGNYTASAQAQGFGGSKINFTVGDSQPTEISISLPVAPGTPNEQELSVSVSTDKKTYAQNELININITATNNSATSTSLYFANGCQSRYLIDDSFDSQRGLMCSMIVGNVDLAPGQSKTWQISYDPASRPILSVGQHKITGKLNSAPAGEGSTYINVVSSTTAEAPVLNFLWPSSGSVGTNVEIRGSGFLQTGNAVNFGFGYIPNLNSYDGQMIVFKVPQSLDPSCAFTNPRCMIASMMTRPGTYPVSVKNSNGTSNSLNFEVTE